jgi:hypothetical protein
MTTTVSINTRKPVSPSRLTQIYLTFLPLRAVCDELEIEIPEHAAIEWSVDEHAVAGVVMNIVTDIPPSDALDEQHRQAVNAGAIELGSRITAELDNGTTGMLVVTVNGLVKGDFTPQTRELTPVTT